MFEIWKSDFWQMADCSKSRTKIGLPVDKMQFSTKKSCKCITGIVDMSSTTVYVILIASKQ